MTLLPLNILSNAILPDFPQSFISIPTRLQLMLVPQRVHWFPEPRVFISRHLAFGGELFHGFALPYGCIPVFNIIEYFRFAHKKATVDPCAIPLRFFHK